MNSLACSDVTNLVDAIRSRVEENNTGMAYIFLKNGEQIERKLTYGELDKEAKKLAATLQQKGLASERVMLLYSSSIDYVIALFACFYAGVIAIPAFPPKNERGVPRVKAIIKDANVKAILTLSTINKSSKNIIDSLQDMDWIMTDRVDFDRAHLWFKPLLTQASIAYLQYTSGSTGAPKGVVVTHGNLLHNLTNIAEIFNYQKNDKIVTWLPIFHDLGLIFGLLHAVFSGTCVFMSPSAFLQRPYRWLKAISDFKSYATGAPNFAYDLCVKRISNEQKAALNLNTLKVALNGAEPVRKHTVDNFFNAFSMCGLGIATQKPSYGLAEATLVISGTRHTESYVSHCFDEKSIENGCPKLSSEEKTGRWLISSGASFSDQTVKIVHPDTFDEIIGTSVGEIWLSGSSVSYGYWGNREASEEIFEAKIASSQQELHFLRTGDLGFVMDEYLFVTGRLKDLIVLNGRNIYPQDVELISEMSHEDLRVAGSASFSVDINNMERLVVIQEVNFRAKTSYDTLIENIKTNLVKQLEVQPYAIVLVKPGSIYKTTSGKVQRRKEKQLFLKGRDNELERWLNSVMEAEDEFETIQNSKSGVTSISSIVLNITSLITKILNLGEDILLDQNTSLISLGVDSIKAAELSSEIESLAGVEIPMFFIMDESSIKHISLEINRLLQERNEVVTIA